MTIDEYDSMYESFDKRLFELSGEESPIVCILNKPLVTKMAKLLNVFVEELYVYISNQKIRLDQSTDPTFNRETQVCIDSAEKSVSIYSRHRDNYLRILSKYDEFIETLDPIERVIAINHIKGNPLHI
jgi:hypothetical protein